MDPASAPIATRHTHPDQIATALWEQSSIPMVEWMLDGTIVDWNPGAVALFGIKAEQAIGENLFRQLLTDANSLPLKTLLQTQRNQLRTMKTLHSHGGETRHGDPALLCEWSHSILSDASQEGDRMLSIITDITSYVQSKRDLKESHALVQQRTETLHDLVEKYQSVQDQLTIAQSNCAIALQTLPTLSDYQPILAASSDVMLVLDCHSIIQKILPTSPSALFRLSEKWIGKSMRDLLPPSQADLVIQSIHVTLDNQQKSRLDYHLCRGETLIWFDATIAPIDRHNVLLVARNITDRRATEESLRQSEAFLHQVFDSLPDPIFVKDEWHRWKLVNHAACDLLTLTQYPAAIATAAQSLSEIDFKMGETRQHIARLEGNAEMIVAFEVALKNDNQRRARRFEVLQVNPEYDKALTYINRLTADKANATARLEHLRNEFTIAKLEFQNAIAQRIVGIESRELVGL